MGKIRRLSEEVIRKIAAGEVIERPASVVKELIENSIDASADRISIKLESGGKKLIRVIDNGEGMTKDDLLLSVERYTTSKISSAVDLSNLRTLGFRGEALSSIAAVSKLSISSKPKDQLVGYKIEVEEGRILFLEEVGIPEGTVVEVRDLFFNVPARKKFLKTEKVELEHSIDEILRFSICYTHIGFSVEHGKKELLNLPPTDDPIKRFSMLFGEDVADDIKRVSEEYDDIVIDAYLTTSIMRLKPDRLFFYVNRRNIRDREMIYSVLKAYDQRIIKGEYPQGAVFIEIDPRKVDFNVHPQKTEVRFQDEKVYSRIASCVKKLFKKSIKFPVSASFPKEESFLFVKEKRASYKTKKIPQIIGQVGKRYIVCEAEEGLLLIDQHGAHERIIYERMKKEIRKEGVQKVIEPKRIELDPEGALVLRKNLDIFRKMKIEIREFGKNTFIIDSYPEVLKGADWKKIINEFLRAKKGYEIFEEALKILACHSAIKAGDELSIIQMKNLVKELYETSIPTNCPHGRPIFHLITYRQLERMFKK